MSGYQFRVVDKSIYFSDAILAQEYAKKHPGCAITRVNNEESSELRYTPQSILDHLNLYVIAQESAKKEIAITLYYHYFKSYVQSSLEFSNSPVMLIGPTGSGKTFIVQEACRFIDMPFIHVDTSSMVSEGIVGYNIGKLAADIIKKAEYDISKAQYCVVFFDEIDKLFHPDNDEYGSEVTHQLLRFIEGTTVNIPKQDIAQSEDYKLNTHKMQFILGGAFQWIIEKKSAATKSSMGFLNDAAQSRKKHAEITLEDLYKEEVPKELLGRMHTIVNLHPLSEEDYYKILTQSKKSPINDIANLMFMHNEKISFDEEVLQAVARYAHKSELGVRSLHQILRKLFNDALFLAPEMKGRTHHIKYNKEDFDE